MDGRVLGYYGMFCILLLLTDSILCAENHRIPDNKRDTVETGGSLGGVQRKMINREGRSITTNAQLTPPGCLTCRKLPADCSEVYAAGNRSSGVYTIQATGLPALKVYCDMGTSGGGWTVFQRRQDGSIDFYRGWDEYAKGFGDVTGEYWLGLHNIHLLTHNKPMELYVYLLDYDHDARYARYDFFAVASEYNKFNLDLGSYYGTAGDSLTYHRGGNFGTKDRDNDSPGGTCGEEVKGAWWYKSCYKSNLNGQYLKGQSKSYALAWDTFRGVRYALKASRMMMRPKF